MTESRSIGAVVSRALLLALTALPLAAWAQSADSLSPAAYFARSDARPPAARPSTDDWPDDDDLAAFLDDADLPRWVAQARAGRALAAIHAGDHLLLRKRKAEGNCAAALEWYRKAEELGSEL